MAITGSDCEVLKKDGCGREGLAFSEIDHMWELNEHDSSDERYCGCVSGYCSSSEIFSFCIHLSIVFMRNKTNHTAFLSHKFLLIPHLSERSK